MYFRKQSYTKPPIATIFWNARIKKSVAFWVFGITFTALFGQGLFLENLSQTVSAELKRDESYLPNPGFGIIPSGSEGVVF
ncbi:hypothetical protein E5S67_02722 [Microcoleus sp. IPMA8]|uniref:Uncharacterized protein n=1 Tax=Microcoleus asticus IPMA8 TaxID=2563858 RepID=A0ABX2CZE0_9CYAN|nr:hypothetical protein [Microcoleus asticus IPMA8]